MRNVPAFKTVLTALAALAVVGMTTASWAQVPVKWQERLLDYKPYDGTGRYTMSTDDRLRSIQGLKVLASRFGMKPYDKLKTTEGTWQTERVIFRDVDTGAVIYRLTNDPWSDAISYFQGNWTADGKYIVWRRKPGMWESSTNTHGPMAMRSDGTELRNAFRDYRMVRNEVCSPTQPDICYAMAGGKTVVAFDLKTGKTHKVLRDVGGCWHLKISLDGKYLMGRGNIEKGGRGLWILSTDGKEYYEISVPESIHDSYQFHPSQRRIMYWYEGRYRKEGFVQCDFDGKNLVKVPVLFDWNHGDVGPDRGIHTGGYITRIKGDTWLAKEVLFHKPGVEHYDEPHNTNGYLSWWPKDRLWAYSTRICYPPYVSELHAFHAEPTPEFVVNRYRICYTALKRRAGLDNPGASPDGTKVLFYSTIFDRGDVYYVVAGLPESPVGLAAVRAAEGVKLTWRPPKHHAEIAGYHVYRSAQSGHGFEPITAKPVAATEFTDTAAPGNPFYAVTAVEHSGLESTLSDDATLNVAARRCVYVEAESGEWSHEIWKAFHGTASNLHYVWMRRKEGEGKLTLKVKLPLMTGGSTLWARLKGETGAQFTTSAGGASVKLNVPASADWTWAKSDGTLRLHPGLNEIVLSSTAYGSAIDCLVITNDPGFNPSQGRRIKWPGLGTPGELKAGAVSPYSVKLSWKPVEAPTFHHYNLYGAKQATFDPDQTTLVASPDGATFLDYGLRPGDRVSYRLTVVDRAGNESPPSAPVQVIVPKVERVIIEKPAADTVRFEVPEKDTYVVWLKLKQGARGGNYVAVSVDGKGSTWTCGFDRLSEESWFSYGRWGRFELEPGEHRLMINNKTKHTVEKVFITNDLSRKPEGHVNLLGGW